MNIHNLRLKSKKNTPEDQTEHRDTNVLMLEC